MRWRAEWVPAVLLAALAGLVSVSATRHRHRPAIASPEPDTGYLGEILRAQNDVLYRWPSHGDTAIRVFIAPAPGADSLDAAYPALAREALGEWRSAGFPVHYTFVGDSAGAEIAVHWLPRFSPEDGQRIGQTDSRHDGDARIFFARVTIALHDSVGRALPPARISVALRHEFGHALGLNHTSDSTSVMFPVSARAMYISDADAATMRALYRPPRR